MKTPAGKKPAIHVTGDTYSAVFYMPPRVTFLDGVNSDTGNVHAMPVGVEYIFRAIRAACNPSGLLDAGKASLIGVQLTRGPGSPPFAGSQSAALYEISKVAEMTDFQRSKPLPLLRLLHADSRIISVSALKPVHPPVAEDVSPRVADILVHWFGELGSKAKRVSPAAPQNCRYHLQVGLATPLESDPATHIAPARIANPAEGRVLVVNVGEICEARRIRRSLSYEAAAVDLLRLLRGDRSFPVPSNELRNLSMAGHLAPKISILAVRLNHSAVFVYACGHDKAVTPTSADPNAGFTEFGSWLLCHNTECAPLSQPELGQMVGYTGFVSAQLGAALAEWMTRTAKDPGPRDFCEMIQESIRRSLVWQKTAYERGCLHLLFKFNGSQWEATCADPTKPRIGYDDMFADILTAILKKFELPMPSASGADLKSCLMQFDEKFRREVLSVQVDIQRAVAHRTQWFMARSTGAEWTGRVSIRGAPDRTDFEATFRKIAIGWLTGQKDNEPAIPIVAIGKAELTDRREIEDFLAIYQALQVYANSQENIPLNIAVFGTPGAGKSFAVKQVVKHLRGTQTHARRFRGEPLTFNLGQFKSLDDLPAALHLVRNECLSSEIPIVFFDEFDSSFNGQAFWWLKFFLAPMQDGDFYHAGQTYKMGRAVFVFAGGINRSFEEFNGRVRNPSFCEAKGPDFISRLKVHLNMQGINKPEDDADQGRYVLRRAVLLRSMVRERLGIAAAQKNVPVLHESVANALLTIDRFKHGVRSLEAIIKMCSTRLGYPIGPSDLPSMDQLEMHVDAVKLLKLVDKP